MLKRIRLAVRSDGVPWMYRVAYDCGYLFPSLVT
jgi:hypothetical protein